MKKQLFNDNWKFQKAGTQEVKNICLPHDAMIFEKRDPNAPSGDAEAFFEAGSYVYEKKAGVNTKHAILSFDGVYKDAKVYLNEELKKEYHYGYAPFTVELGELKEEDLIRVECGIAALPDSRWYPGAGIYLYTSEEEEYIGVHDVKVSTLDYKEGKILVSTGNTNAVAEVLEEGKVVASGKGDKVELTIENARLWDEEHPFLYTVRVSLKNDTVEERFGIRQLEKKKDGLYLNGKKILLRGGCLHSDNGLLGAASYYDAEYRRVKILKDAGFNAIRCAHNPASKHLLDACDELGVYVMDEAWDMWFHKKSVADYGGKLWRQFHEDDLRNMVDRDFNHPSVILYSIGNEVSEPSRPEGVEATKEMISLLHTLDRNRLVTAGFNLMIIYNASKGKGIYNEEGGRDTSDDRKMAGMSSTMFNMITSMVGTGMNKAANSRKADEIVSPVCDALDIAGYNYASGRYPLDAKLHPDRLIFGSETFPHTIDQNWTMCEKIDTLVGDFMWTAWDYIGENGIGAWAYTKDGGGFSKPYPWWLADVGAYDICGNPNGEAFWASAAWDALDKPAITLQPINHNLKPYKGSWRGTNGLPSYAWRGCEGKKAVVEVFFKCARVELYRNGKKVAAGKPKGSRTIFKIRYVPGTLEAIAYDNNGNRLASNKLVSAEDKLTLSVRPEKEKVSAGDLVYVNVCVADEKGTVESNHDVRVNVEVENGELLAFGSANPATEEDIHEGSYTTYYGRALAIVKTSKKGTVRVRAFNDAMKAEADITVQ